MLVSALVTVGVMTKNSELLVLRACGISLYRAMVPLVVFALLASGALFLLQDRVLATTNRDLEEMVREGRFREDLYYRLNVFPLRVPPLRERPRDIVPLARHFVARNADGRRLRFSAEAEALLRSHSWPGNVRELENAIQRAAILAGGEVIGAADIILPTPGARVGTTTEILATDIKTLERDHILATLKEVGGSRKLAVQRLGISERTLRYKLQQYRMDGVL